jgi:hypothetical protein
MDAPEGLYEVARIPVADPVADLLHRQVVILVNPEGLPKVAAYHHVSVATGSKVVFIAGQIAWDADGARSSKSPSPPSSSCATSTSLPPWSGSAAPSTTWL